jgi:hypothetical protein
MMTTRTAPSQLALRIIAYKHIPTQTLFPPAEAKLVKLDVKVTAKNIGYIVGAGDEVPAALQQMGCRVTILGPIELSGSLSAYDAIVVGVRALYQRLFSKLSGQPDGLRKKWWHNDRAICYTGRFRIYSEWS